MFQLTERKLAVGTAAHADAAFAVPDEDFAEWDLGRLSIYSRKRLRMDTLEPNNTTSIIISIWLLIPHSVPLRAHYQSKLGDLYSRGQLGLRSSAHVVQLGSLYFHGRRSGEVFGRA